MIRGRDQGASGKVRGDVGGVSAPEPTRGNGSVAGSAPSARNTGYSPGNGERASPAPPEAASAESQVPLNPNKEPETAKQSMVRDSKEAGPNVAKKSSNSGGWLSSKMQKWFLPKEAKVAKGLGKTMEAYYDESKKRWVFPGEEDKDDAPALPPPPPMSLSTTSTTAAPPTGASSATHAPPGNSGLNSRPGPTNVPGPSNRGFYSASSTQSRRKAPRSRYAAIPGLALTSQGQN